MLRIIVDWLILSALFLGGVGLLMWYMMNVQSKSISESHFDPTVFVIIFGLIMALVSLLKPRWVTFQIVRSSRGDEDQKHPVTAALIMFFFGLGIATGFAILFILNIPTTLHFHRGSSVGYAVAYSTIIEAGLLWRPMRRFVEKKLLDSKTQT